MLIDLYRPLRCQTQGETGEQISLEQSKGLDMGGVFREEALSCRGMSCAACSLNVASRFQLALRSTLNRFPMFN